MATGRHRRYKPGRRTQLRLQAAGALLLAVSAGIHLDLYLTGYRSIPVVGWLFLVQVVVGCVLMVAVLVTHSWLAAAASAGFALSTLGAYLLAVWTGLFGFREIRTRAGIAAGLIEVAAFGVLALAAIAGGPAAQADGSVSRTALLVEQVRAVLSRAISAVGAVSVAALALLAVAEVSASRPPSPAATTAGTTLKVTKIGGVPVLANDRGLTLYWFAPDSPAASRCTGECAAYWPPVTGDPQAGQGIPGTFGTISRPGGGRQMTYDGHPLYTYVGDSGPGQANGNDLDLNGGLWYEMRVSGRAGPGT
jgi:predicted lipoprotein with Yx(FWY)xxD motif